MEKKITVAEVKAQKDGQVPVTFLKEFIWFIKTKSLKNKTHLKMNFGVVCYDQTIF